MPVPFQWCPIEVTESEVAYLLHYPCPSCGVPLGQKCEGHVQLTAGWDFWVHFSRRDQVVREVTKRLDGDQETKYRFGFTGFKELK